MSNSVNSVEVRKIHKRFGATEILKDVSLEIRQGEFLVLVGPSGCGKSTLLRMIAGLEEVSSGEIMIGGKVVNDVDPKDRDIGMVFQSYALYPHMNVFENMAFGLRVRKIEDSEIRKRVHEAADLLRLSQLLERKPKELSGGQRQRVALGRAIVRKARVFLFDEPLSNLDAKLRNEMRVEIKRLHQVLGNTMIYVTHDQVEATTMGDRIAVLNAGVVQQVDTPTRVYLQPANRFVASFIGVPEMNFVEGHCGGGEFISDDGVFRAGGLACADTDGPVIFGARPEFLSLSPSGQGGVPAQVELVENLGSQSLVHCRVGAQLFRVLCSFDRGVRPGANILLAVDPKRSFLFDKSSGKVLIR